MKRPEGCLPDRAGHRLTVTRLSKRPFAGWTHWRCSCGVYQNLSDVANVAPMWNEHLEDDTAPLSTPATGGRRDG